MDFSQEHTSHHPRERVFTTHRDQLVDVVPYLDAVAEVRRLSLAREAGGAITLRHRWTAADAALPKLLRPFLPPRLLIWEDTTRWDASTWTATWTITVPALGAMVTIAGTNVYEEAPRGCVVRLKGAFDFNPDRVPNMPALPPQAVPLIERFVVGLIVPMIKQSSQAVASYLDARSP